MFGFVGGLILGGVFGVLADRLWSHFENIIRVDISTGLFDNIKGHMGFSFSIKNTGVREIPDYRVCLFSPQCGSLFAFPSEVTGPLCPQQERDHRVVLFLDGKPNRNLLAWLTRIDREPDIDSEVGCSSFRMVMKDSDRVLYKNAAMGNELTRALRDINKAGDSSGLSGVDWDALRTSRKKGLLRWAARSRT